MCGIGGTIGHAPDEGVLERMAMAMGHRGPDGQRTWSDRHVGMAFRRLAIIDLNERSMQPMHLGDLHLAFNGEIYNYRELRTALERRGRRFTTEGDAEVLLHAWDEWGERALDRLNGMYALAVWDASADALTLAVDPFGEKPLYVAHAGDRLAFASDVRALLHARPDLGRHDAAAAAAFVSLGMLPTPPRTCFAGVERLPGGHVLRWRSGRVEWARHWVPAGVEVPARDEDAAEALRALLDDAVRLRLRSDVAVGTSLSGGVDSAAIAGLVQRHAHGQERHAFTARFPGFARDEWRYAQLAASAAGVTDHHAVTPTGAELLDDLDALVRHQEEPIPTTSVYAQWRVMRLARETDVTVLLDGQGADELFGGYAGMEPLATLSEGPRAVARSAIRDRGGVPGLARACASGRVPAVLARRARRRAASPYVTAAAGRAAAAVQPANPRREAGGPLRRSLATQAFSTSLPHLLRFADRDSMAHSREVRLPFLDRRVAEFALSAPARLLIRNGVRKRVLRDALRGLVPDAILDRRDKVGFETPETDWLESPDVRGAFAAIALDPAAPTAGLVDRRALEADVAAGRWRDPSALWRVVSLSVWSTSFAPGRPRPASPA